MGFQKPNLEQAYEVIRRLSTEIRSPYNDGFTSLHCKQDLFLLKCFIEDCYESLPKFCGEEEWEKDRMIQLLKKK
jgi:hypothetical protein